MSLLHLPILMPDMPIRRYLFLAVARDWAELWLRRTWQRVLRL